MIFNPSAAGSGGTESYTITNNAANTGLSLPPTADPGYFFKDVFHIGQISSILTEDGEKVPYDDDINGLEAQLTFVMPKANIVVS